MGERIAIYARVSTEDQAEKQTIDIQLRDCRGWVEREGHYDVAEFCDDGVSGATAFDERPAGADLLARASDFDRIVFYSVDRLARDTIEGGLALKAFARAGIAVTFVTIQLDLETPEGVMILDQMLSFAKYERAVTARRTAKGRRKSAAAGNWPGSQTPYAYCRVDKKLRVRLSEARVLRRMIRLVLDENMGAAMVAKEFERRGYTPPHNAARWWPSSVHHFLRKPYYSAGEIEYKGHQVPCPILIRPEEKRKIAAVFKQRKQRSSRRTKAFHLLQHLMFCRECDSMYHSNTHQGIRVYYCGARRNSRTNGHGDQLVHNPNIDMKWWWKAPVLEAIVKKKILAFLLSPAETIRRNAAYLERVEAGSEADKEMAELRNNLARLGEERDRVLSQNQKGYVSEHEMDKVMAGIAARREKVDERLDKLEEDAAVVDPDDLLWIADLEDKTVIYRLLLGELRIAEENIDVVLSHEYHDPREWRTLIESVVDRIWVENNGEVSIVFAGSAC